MIIYDGPSMIDGKPIVAIATFDSMNKKTGPIVQTWIIRQDESPIEARALGWDYSICGNYPYRDGRCYVRIEQGPTSVYKKYKKGGYKSFDIKKIEGKQVRIGSYGDPCAVPVEVWKEIISATAGHVGYTHLWREHEEFKGLLQASCDNTMDFIDASLQSWGTFRIIEDAKNRTSNEITCLNITHGITCEKCGMCNGSKDNNMVIEPHGNSRKKFFK